MDEVSNEFLNDLEEGFDDTEEETEEDELGASGMHVEGEDDDEVPIEPETE